MPAASKLASSRIFVVSAARYADVSVGISLSARSSAFSATIRHRRDKISLALSTAPGTSRRMSATVSRCNPRISAAASMVPAVATTRGTISNSRGFFDTMLGRPAGLPDDFLGVRVFIDSGSFCPSFSREATSQDMRVPPPEHDPLPRSSALRPDLSPVPHRCQRTATAPTAAAECRRQGLDDKQWTGSLATPPAAWAVR